MESEPPKFEERKAKSFNYRQQSIHQQHAGKKKETIEEFKHKLVRLEKNKNDLESKMKEFEEKIRASSSRLQ